MVNRVGTCRVCKQMFWYDAPSWHGKGRTTCDTHRAEARREGTKNRVRKHRKEVADQTAARPVLIVHIRSCNWKTYCGRDFDPIVARNIAIDRKEGRIDTIICKTCYRAFMADEGDKPL